MLNRLCRQTGWSGLVHMCPQIPRTFSHGTVQFYSYLWHIEHTDRDWICFLSWWTAGKHCSKPTGTLRWPHTIGWSKHWQVRQSSTKKGKNICTDCFKNTSNINFSCIYKLATMFSEKANALTPPPTSNPSPPPWILSFSTAVTMKIRSRSPKSKQFFVMS